MVSVMVPSLITVVAVPAPLVFVIARPYPLTVMPALTVLPLPPWLTAPPCVKSCSRSSEGFVAASVFVVLVVAPLAVHSMVLGPDVIVQIVAATAVCGLAITKAKNPHAKAGPTSNNCRRRPTLLEIPRLPMALTSVRSPRPHCTRAGVLT